MKSILLLAIILMLFSCTNGHEKIKNKSANSKSLKTEIERPICKSIETQYPNTADPVIIQTCIWKKHIFKRTGSSDYNGRYSYEYSIYKLVKNEEIKVKNSDFFNSRVHELEKRINYGIAKELKGARKYEDNEECLREVGKPDFSINDMGISINQENKMVFNVTFGLGGACFNVDGASVEFALSELLIYIR